MEGAEESEVESLGCLPSSLWGPVAVFTLSKAIKKDKNLQAAKTNRQWHSKGVTCLPGSSKQWEKTRWLDYVSDKTLTFTHSPCAWKRHIRNIFKGKVTFKNDLLFLGLKKFWERKEIRVWGDLHFPKWNSFLYYILSLGFSLDVITSIAMLCAHGRQIMCISFGVKLTDSLDQKTCVCV